ncbi:MAG: hypothetical protein HYW52_11225 [Gemmatimonadetes bacterium]|nr:hypothetical protein [Gemmatimonadota bacterium]
MLPVAAAAVALWSGPLQAQGYRVRLDTRFQSVSFRGVAFDSVLRSDVVVGPNGGFMTSGGFAVSCPEAAAYCTFFRPGPTTSAGPVSGTANATLWGFGVPGLQLHVTARAATDLADAGWPGTEPAVQLLEGYAAYSRDFLSLKLGRTHDANRLGWVGFDGATLELRPLGRSLRVFGYGGRALARSYPLPVTSTDLNPLGDSLELPNRDQILLAGGFGWFLPEFEGRVLYQREDRRGVNATVSERVAADGSLAASPQVTLSGGGDYNLATAEWGKADLALNFLTTDRRLRVTAGGRRYRPYFDLWSIWGAFTPVAYSAGFGSAAWQAMDGLEVRVRGELYQFDESGAATPLAAGEDDGWRGSVSATLLRFANWSFDAGYQREVGPGASSQGYEVAATYRPMSAPLVTAEAARMVRPLEYRFDDARLWSYGLRLDYQAAQGLRLTADARGYSEERQRDDAANLSWSQLRLNVGAIIEFGSGSDSRRLHPAILRIPEGRRPR